MKRAPDLLRVCQKILGRFLSERSDLGQTEAVPPPGSQPPQGNKHIKRPLDVLVSERDRICVLAGGRERERES